jgi:NADH-quinone oxidoreductase subunit L
MFYSKLLYSVAERQLIDGVVNGTYSLARAAGGIFKTLQAGKLNLYALFLSFGFFVLLLISLFWR